MTSKYQSDTCRRPTSVKEQPLLTSAATPPKICSAPNAGVDLCRRKQSSQARRTCSCPHNRAKECPGEKWGLFGVLSNLFLFSERVVNQHLSCPAGTRLRERSEH